MRSRPLLLALLGGAAGAAVAVRLRRSTLRRHGSLLDGRPGLGPDGVVAGGAAMVLPADGERAALVLHGFGDTPQSVGYLAGYLHGLGYAVHAPLFPGHGRTLRAFTRSGADAWIAHARDALGALRARHRHVVIVGQSMGGAIATILAAEAPPPDAVVLLAPYLAMPTSLRHLARAHPLWSPLLPLVASGGERSILDEAERGRSLALGVVSGRMLAELRAVVERAAAALPRVTAPALVVQSRRDHRIAPDACAAAVRRLGSRRKHLVWLDEGGHVLAVDHGRERLFALAAAWLERELTRRELPTVRRGV